MLASCDCLNLLLGLFKQLHKISHLLLATSLKSFCFFPFLVLVQAFMLKRASEEPLGHAAAIITDVLENAESNHVINASQKRALLQEMALRLS